MTPGNADLDRRHERRDLSPEQLDKLLDVTRAAATDFRGLTGNDRYHLYLTATGTGFRASELACLTPEYFNLDAATPFVKPPIRRVKNKKETRQPLPRVLTEALRAYLDGRPPSDPIWPGTWFERASDMLKEDLEAAGIPYVVQGPDGPLYADFHALRHTFVTMLERSGVSLKQAMQLARHSDPKLTLKRYTHADLATLGGAVDKLELPGSEAAQALTVEQMATALVLYRTVLECFLGIRVAPRVAPDVTPDGDGPELPGTIPFRQGPESSGYNPSRDGTLG